MFKKISNIISLLLTISFVNAQEYPDHNKYFIFLEAKTHDIKIIEKDSIIYTNNFQNPQKLKKDDFPELLNYYQYQYIINNKNYFVNNGGGVVLEYHNNEIKRIDDSFLHKNQYVASPFNYKNEIYLFGGYGLFTSKNMLTKYDFKSREWFLIPYTSIERPTPGENYESILIKDYLYIFGGTHQNETGMGEIPNTPLVLWRLDLKTKSWENLGNLNLKYIPRDHHYGINNFIANNKLYIISSLYSAIIDIPQNKITYYKSPLIITDEKIVYNPKNNTLNFLKNLSSNRKTTFVSIKLDDFFKEPFESEIFYEKPVDFFKWTAYLSFILIVISPIGIWKYRKRKKSKIVHFRENKIIYVQTEQKIIFNNQQIHDLTNLEYSVLKFLMEHINSFIPIHNINFIIEKEVDTQSSNTILRKREAVSHLLKSKLSIMLNIPYEEVIIEQKNTQDRRIKEIKLNEKYFKII